MSTEDRFWAKVDKRGPNECWEWTGARTSKNYGNFWTGSRYVTASSFSYELHNGPLLDDQMACHTCDNPPCINPAHLFPGTFVENMQDMVNKGRSLRGEAHNMRRLTESQVREMRRLASAGELQANIADMFGVTFQHVSAIVLRKKWSHI